MNDLTKKSAFPISNLGKEDGGSTRLLLNSFAQTALETEIEQRFGVLPNFFRLVTEPPEITANLWGFARFAYLDNPLPSLFKERLFVYLSRFCEARYCIVRHVGFLVGLGYPSGDRQCRVQTVDEVVRLLQRPFSRSRQLDLRVALCETCEAPVSEIPEPDSALEEAMMTCASHVFLETPDASRCLNALRRVLGAVRFEHLAVFLAFVRTAHHWTKIHELSFEEDVLNLLAAHQVLAECLLNDPEALSSEISQKLLDELISLRKHSQHYQALSREHEELLQAHQTERKQAKAALQEREARLRALFDGSYEFIGLLSPDGTLLEANRAACEWIGCPREEVIGKLFWETPWWTHTPGASDQVRQAIKQAANGEFVRQEVALHSPQGVVTIFDFSLHPILDQEGQVIFLVPEGRDITESIRAARESERRYRDGAKLTEINRALVGALEFEQVAMLICRAARELTGADGATFVIREGERVRCAEENAISPLWKGQDFPIEGCISGWAMIHAETAVIEDIYADERIPHDAYRPTFVQSLVMTPVGPGFPVASIGTYWARRYKATAYEIELLQSLASAADLALAGVRAYNRARLASAEAEQANRLKDEFLATLSHELRSPLNSIIGYSEVLLRSADSTPVPMIQQAVAAIYRNAQAQAQLINDLLDLSRLQTGKLSLNRRPVNLAPVIGDAVESLRAIAGEKQIKLDIDFTAEPLSVNADPVRIQQIVWNLVTNAVKFTPQGGRVAVSLRRKDDEAILLVEDTGQGIEREFLPHVFTMFRQADARTTRSHGGMGIGLALVSQLTELHDGQIEAFSEGPGRGACFTVRLPLHSLTTIDQTAAVRRKEGRLVGTRILVVDDTQDSLDMLRILLTGEGAEVKAALSGEEGLKMTSSLEFDLIISDISMPGMDGYDFIQSLKAEPRYAKTPVIALTGFGRAEDVQHARQAGFTTHITKPLDFENLIRIAHLMVHAQS